jgi:hypothetical protein
LRSAVSKDICVDKKELMNGVCSKGQFLRIYTKSANRPQKIGWRFSNITSSAKKAEW